jgi:ribonuclease Z
VFCRELPYAVRLNLIDPRQHALIAENRSFSVRSVPLKHRIPTCGYLFAEKPGEPHLLRDMADFYRIPPKARAAVKCGADYVTPEGEVIPNSRLTRPADPPIRYAYCSDTAFAPEIIPWIEGVDCLYHEATFTEADLPRARETFHSTARQAAEIARRAQVKQLVLGHYSARYEDTEPLKAEAEAVFPGTIAGTEGLALSLTKKDG